MEIELTPEPADEIVEAVAEALEQVLLGAVDPGLWWRAGIRENLDADPPYPP